MKTYSIRPYAFKNNEFIGLKYRYEFVKKLIDNNYHLKNEQIIKTRYWKILNQNLNIIPRDGGKNWVYKNPTLQTQRFISLIKHIFKYGYIIDQKSNLLSNYELSSKPHIEKNALNETIKVDYTNRDFNGLIEVVKIPGTDSFSVLNGNHRMAILKCFKDNNIFKNDKIKVKIYEEKKSFFSLFKKIIKRFSSKD